MVDIGYGSVNSLLSMMEKGLLHQAPQSLHGHSSFIRRFKIREALEGHTGCVNRLAFSEDASLVISGSDDCTLRIWSVDSDTGCSHRATVSPGHLANIFGVAFMPETNNHYVASAGLDKQVRHSHVESNRSTLWLCHDKSVKTVSPLDKNTFVSASRDGTARLFDIRVKPTIVPPVIVRMPVGLSRQLPINSAIPSPTCAHHLLVAAHEPYVRVFDLRLSPPPKIVSAKGYAIESYCPPHLHPCAPEQPSFSGFRGVFATYANFSPNGKHIVATYFEDTVSVFDRPFLEGRQLAMSRNCSGGAGHVLCRSPFPSRRQCLNAVSKLLNDAATCLMSKNYSRALAAANHALLIDERNLFALVCKIYAHQLRGQTVDFRIAYSTLQKLKGIISSDLTGEAIAYLWSTRSDTFGSHGIKLAPIQTTQYDPSMPADQIHQSNMSDEEEPPSWGEISEIWMAIFDFMQAFNLSRLIPSVYFTMLHASRSKERMLTIKRLEHLDKMCRRLEAYRNKACPTHTTHPVRWATYVQRALGGSDDHDILYSGTAGALRKRVLTALVDIFHTGLDKLRKVLTDCMSCLRPDGHGRRDFAAVGNTLEPRISLGRGHALVYIVQQPIRRRWRQQESQQPQNQSHPPQTQHAGAQAQQVGDDVRDEDDDIDELNHVDVDDDDDVIVDDDLYDDGDDENDVVEGEYIRGFYADQDASPDSEYYGVDPFLLARQSAYHNEYADQEAQSSSGSSTTAENDENTLWGGLDEMTGYRPFVGHISKQTDIKEANFFGSSNQVILSGSDDGSIYMWNAMTGELLNKTMADENIVNCVLGHPHRTMILASGIDDSIKVLAP